jgi:hypothetical protein
MPHDLMTKCEQKKLFIRDGKKVWEWVEVPVSSMTSGGWGDIRCVHCHGEVKVHKQYVKHGPADQVEHRSRRDSENCIGEIYYAGSHKLSSIPVQ